jgi:hypothetical protein
MRWKGRYSNISINYIVNNIPSTNIIIIIIIIIIIYNNNIKIITNNDTCINLFTYPYISYFIVLINK